MHKQHSKVHRIPLALRVANIDGTWYYDLTNEKWEFIQITPEGWRYSKKFCNIPAL